MLDPLDDLTLLRSELRRLQREDGTPSPRRLAQLLTAGYGCALSAEAEAQALAAEAAWRLYDAPESELAALLRERRRLREAARALRAELAPLCDHVKACALSPLGPAVSPPPDPAPRAS